MKCKISSQKERVKGWKLGWMLNVSGTGKTSLAQFRCIMSPSRPNIRSAENGESIGSYFQTWDG
jgi:hypothetical protein